MRQKRGGY